MNKIFFVLPLLSLCAASQVQGQPDDADREKKENVAIPVKPAPMTKEKILSWLEPDKHVDDQWRIISKESRNKEPHTVPKEYLTILQQITAIENAGESKDKEFIPALLVYMDYVSPTFNPPSFFFMVQNKIEWRRKMRPAVDALMKINSAEGLSSYIEADHPLRRRVGALAVLREIDYEKAVELGSKLLEDPEAKKDVSLTDWIKSLMQRELPPPKLEPAN